MVKAAGLWRSSKVDIYLPGGKTRRGAEGGTR